MDRYHSYENKLVYLEQKIEELLVSQDLQIKKRELPSELNRMFDRYAETLYDILCVGLTFFRGFNAITQDELKMEEEAENLVRKWVKSTDRNRSGRIIANLSANGYVAALEDFLNDIDEYVRNKILEEKNNGRALSKFRIDYENIEKESNRTPPDKKPLIFYLKPSGRKKYRWLEMLKKLYRMNLDPSVDEVIKDMISNRQAASHQAIHKQTMAVSGEQLKLWHLGTLYLILSLVVAVHDRIKKKE